MMDYHCPELHEVIKRGLVPQVRYLVDFGADIDGTDREGKSPVILCAFIEPENWGVGLLRMLIEKGARLSRYDSYGLNVLHYGCIYERVELVRVLLNAIDFDLNQADKEGNTALHYAVKSGNSVLVKLLVEYFTRYKVSLDKVNKNGNTALQEAMNLKQQLCAHVLRCPHVTYSDFDSETVSSRKFSDGYFSDVTSTSGDDRSRTVSRPKTAGPTLHRSGTELIYRGNKASEMNAARFAGCRQQNPNVRDPKKIIHCVSLNDFRNSLEYIMHLAQSDSPLPSPRTIDDMYRPKTAVIKRPPVPRNWRSDFKQIYHHYEYHCSGSFRGNVPMSVVKENDLPPGSPTAMSTADDDKGSVKKGRRMSNKPGSPHESIPRSRRQSLALRSKRLSVASIPSSKLSATSNDESLHSSTESLNSGKSSRKKDSHGDKDTGRVSRVAKRRSPGPEKHVDDSHSFK